MQTVLVECKQVEGVKLPLILSSSGREMIDMVGGHLEIPQFAQLALQGRVEGGHFRQVGMEHPVFGNSVIDTAGMPLRKYRRIPLKGLRIELCIIEEGNFNGCVFTDLTLVESMVVNVDFGGVKWGDGDYNFTGTKFKACDFAGCDPVELEKLGLDKAFSDFRTIWPENYTPLTKPYHMGVTPPLLEGVWHVARA